MEISRDYPAGRNGRRRRLHRGAIVQSVSQGRGSNQRTRAIRNNGDNPMNGFGFWLLVALMFIAFSGEPDLIDAIILNLTNRVTQ